MAKPDKINIEVQDNGSVIIDFPYYEKEEDRVVVAKEILKTVLQIKANHEFATNP